MALPRALLQFCLALELLLSLPGCNRDPFGDSYQVSVEEQAVQSQFDFERSKLSLPEYRRLKGLKTEECFLAYRHPTELNMCVYTFSDPGLAREAGAQVSAWKHPFGRFRTYVVLDSRLFAMDGQIKDQPIVDLLKAELLRVHDFVAD